MLHDSSQASSGHRISVPGETSGAAAGRGPAPRASRGEYRPTGRVRFAFHDSGERDGSPARKLVGFVVAKSQARTQRKVESDCSRRSTCQAWRLYAKAIFRVSGDPDLASLSMAIGCQCTKRVRAFSSRPSYLGGYVRALVLTNPGCAQPAQIYAWHPQTFTSNPVPRRGP